MSQIEEKFDSIDTIDTIDEKLAELKTTVIVPNYGDILGKFEWTREWFSSIEDILIAIAFRGESDQPILDFIRGKIRETDVRSFNKIMASFGIEKIVNHYDWIIDNGYYIPELELNNNDAIADYLIEKIRNISTCHYISKNTNDKVVRYLVTYRPDLIDWREFSENPNDIAIDYMLENLVKIDLETFDKNTNVRVMNYMLNLENVPVHYTHINDPSNSNNDLCVKYLIDNPRSIKWGSFVRNPNDIAVDYVLEHINELRNIDIFNLGRNYNPKVSKFLVDNPQHIYDARLFATRSDDIAVDYMMSNPAYLTFDTIYMNTNDRILEYLMTNPGTKNNKIFQNTCEYNMQKINAFNAAGMFPRLPHLRL